LIERVRLAAHDTTIDQSSLGIGVTTLQAICREHGITWIPRGQRGIARLLTDATVREALQGRTAQQAAWKFDVHVQVLYNRFAHLLTKRTKPNSLDDHQREILRLAYRDRLPRSEIARRFDVSEGCVKKSIQRWSKQGAKLGGAALPELPRQRPGPKPGRKGHDMAAS
jgi:transposase